MRRGAAAGIGGGFGLLQRGDQPVGRIRHPAMGRCGPRHRRCGRSCGARSWPLPATPSAPGIRSCDAPRQRMPAWRPCRTQVGWAALVGAVRPARERYGRWPVMDQSASPRWPIGTRIAASLSRDMVKSTENSGMHPVRIANSVDKMKFRPSGSFRHGGHAAVSRVRYPGVAYPGVAPDGRPASCAPAPLLLQTRGTIGHKPTCDRGGGAARVKGSPNR